MFKEKKSYFSRKKISIDYLSTFLGNIGTPVRNIHDNSLLNTVVEISKCFREFCL